MISHVMRTNKGYTKDMKKMSFPRRKNNDCASSFYQHLIFGRYAPTSRPTSHIARTRPIYCSYRGITWLMHTAILLYFIAKILSINWSSMPWFLNSWAAFYSLVIAWHMVCYMQKGVKRLKTATLLDVKEICMPTICLHRCERDC